MQALQACIMSLPAGHSGPVHGGYSGAEKYSAWSDTKWVDILIICVIFLIEQITRGIDPEAAPSVVLYLYSFLSEIYERRESYEYTEIYAKINRSDQSV